jgi:hypothetical protein
MTMHLEGPWLSTTGKKRGPKKWASSAEKRKAEQRKTDWELKLKEFDKMKPKFSNTKPAPKRKSDWSLGAPKTPPGRETVRIASQDTGWVPCTTAPNQEYTGTKVKGIGTMHKSNAVPIFSDEEAVAISTMRR